jgi:hypothetical protein
MVILLNWVFKPLMKKTAPIHGSAIGNGNHKLLKGKGRTKGATFEKGNSTASAVQSNWSLCVSLGGVFDEAISYVI